MCAFVCVCACVMSAWGKPKDYYEIATISYWCICISRLSLEKNEALSKLPALWNNVLSNNYLGKEPKTVMTLYFVLGFLLNLALLYKN